VTAHPVRDNRQNGAVFLALPPVSCLPVRVPPASKDQGWAACPPRRRLGVRQGWRRGRPLGRKYVSKAVRTRRELTVLAKKEPVPEPALEVLERGVAHKVAVLAVLQWAVGPASAVKGVVAHSNDVHDGGE
jgi:hypothetical protein